MQNLFDLTGEVAIVTGGNKGIGRGMAEGLAGAGAAVVIAARDEAATNATVAAITASGGQALALRCDVTRREDLERAVSVAVETYGRLSILVNNAGASRSARPERQSMEDWDWVFDVNLRSCVQASQVAFPAMVENGRGKIINNASVYSLMASIYNPSYGATKAALVQFTRSLANSAARKNIQVNAICPGVIETELWEGNLADGAIRERVLRRTPAGRFGKPEDLAGATVFLASRASDWMTGQTIVIDGGMTSADAIQFG